MAKKKKLTIKDIVKVDGKVVITLSDATTLTVNPDPTPPPPPNP